MPEHRSWSAMYSVHNWGARFSDRFTHGGIVEVMVADANSSNFKVVKSMETQRRSRNKWKRFKAGLPITIRDCEIVSSCRPRVDWVSLWAGMNKASKYASSLESLVLNAQWWHGCRGRMERLDIALRTRKNKRNGKRDNDTSMLNRNRKKCWVI